ncbi:MAG: ABC transporter ATP-binding protein [Acidobacteria bacterium]|nr:MAG: ABC transporter ATP-binding protein [Acidobacteriota bacterium]REK06385.1 MAG: ABC transporter ATP-binding protein [Acidobacteriota bacterium]
MRRIPNERGFAAELESASKRYGDVVALDAVDLQLRHGQTTAILGANGAGKTTTVKLLLGLIRPSSGTVRLYGDDPTRPRVRTRTGSMMQISSLPATLRVVELIDLWRSYYPAPLDRGEVVELAGLSGLERRLYGKLSGGQQQRVCFALALSGDPDLLFLDEPTVGLDVETRRNFWAQIRRLVEQGKTIVLTTHYLEEADALSDRIVVLHEGSICADGTPHQIKSAAASRRIRCVTRVRVDEALAIAGVRQAYHDKAVLEILAAEAEPVVRELLARDPGLSQLEITGAGIEDAFLDLTGSQRREDAA